MRGSQVHLCHRRLAWWLHVLLDRLQVGGDIIAASAPNSGSGSAARGCVARAVPLFAWHGDADMTVAYSGGKMGVDSWVTHDKCTGTPTDFMVGSAKCQDWNMCAAGSEVKFCTVPGGGHTYTRAATAAIWDFFKAHPLP
jgi:poly(3-hydroxybutyrate) depolymerase